MASSSGVVDYRSDYNVAMSSAGSLRADCFTGVATAIESDVFAATKTRYLDLENNPMHVNQNYENEDEIATATDEEMVTSLMEKWLS